MNRRRAFALSTLAVVGAALPGCSSSAAPPPASNTAHTSTTNSIPPQTGPRPTTPQQTVSTWFTEVDAKNPSSEILLAQPYRRDWANTRTTVWPLFSNVNCTTQSQTATTAKVHCTLAETRYAGETHPPTYWNFDLTSQSGNTWLITHYASG